VEQDAALKDGYPRSLIDGPDNVVLIPTRKHREITGWYQTKNKDTDGIPPREYLRRRTWEQRRAMGLDVLIMHGVLKP
jgi:hypothetical protein